MSERLLSRIDVNLLVALDVLLDERQVTRAARRLGVTQSAMSQTLGRLRELFDDPLLVRDGNRMAPTPRAQALALPLSHALRQLQAAVQGAARFDPATSDRRFTLAAHDYNAYLLLPDLMARLGVEAPGLAVDVVPVVPSEIVERLRGGEVDLCVSVVRDPPGALSVQPLVEERLVSMVRRDHPLLSEKGPSLERWASYPHGILSITGRGPGTFDALLAEVGLSRALVVRVPYFLAAPAVVLRSDVVLSVPGRLAAVFARQHPVGFFDPPLGASPFTLSMSWSRRLDADPGHRWFRAAVAAALAT
ncbi:MAG: LysR family transcriptional regulator [Alphaproteobacteria bacterium]|nr:LysR family transcriptional regulator [Alphaproteobacteria bacterium]